MNVRNLAQNRKTLGTRPQNNTCDAVGIWPVDWLPLPNSQVEAAAREGTSEPSEIIGALTGNSFQQRQDFQGRGRSYQ